jgi:hypothetical protein
MSRWSSFKSQQTLTENWRRFLNEEEQIVYGLNSEDNPDSLQNLLSGVVDDGIIKQIINLIASAADDEGVMLEAATLQGSKSERDRIFSADTTKEILQGLSGLGLAGSELKKVIKVLNQWGRLNTVKFENPQVAEPVASVEEPEEEAPAEAPADEDGVEDYDGDEETEKVPVALDPEEEKDRDLVDKFQRAIVVPLATMKDTYGNYVEILDFIEKIQDDREEIKELYDQGEYFEAARKSKELFDFLKSEEAQENFKNMKKLYENGGINKDASDMTDAEIDQVLEGFFDFILD